MNKHMMLQLLFVTAMATAFNVRGATGNLIVFDDADENGFSHANSIYGAGTVFYNATTTVHGGTVSVAILDQQSSAASWLAPIPYSTFSDYDGVSFWVNGGSNGGEDVTVVLYNQLDLVGTTSLASLYGAPIPASTWIHLQLSFFSPLFNPAGDNATTFTDITFRSHSGSSTIFFLDDIALTGVDIFKSDFE
jgi:hypothetical protein